MTECHLFVYFLIPSIIQPENHPQFRSKSYSERIQDRPTDPSLLDSPVPDNPLTKCRTVFFTVDTAGTSASRCRWALSAAVICKPVAKHEISRKRAARTKAQRGNLLQSIMTLTFSHFSKNSAPAPTAFGN